MVCCWWGVLKGLLIYFNSNKHILLGESSIFVTSRNVVRIENLLDYYAVDLVAQIERLWLIGCWWCWGDFNFFFFFFFEGGSLPLV